MRSIGYVLSPNDNVAPHRVGDVRPGFIVYEWPNQYANVVVFIDGYNDIANNVYPVIWVTSVPYDKGKEIGTYHFQEE